MPVNWWPSVPDEWSWMPAVHVAALVMALAPAAIILGTSRARGASLTRRSRWLVGLATLLLLVALDWPIGHLAQVTLAGRSMQYMLISLAAAPLLLLGTPRWHAEGRGVPRRLLERLASAPWLGAIMLALAAWLTHGESVVDEFEQDALGQISIRTVWFATALFYWWPLVGPGPERERLPYLAALGYLVLPFVFPKFPAAVWVFSTDPIYDRFATTPDPWELSRMADQGLAGFILWLPGSAVVAVAVYLLLRHWLREDRRLGIRERLDVPADPEAVALLVRPDVPELWPVVEELVRIIDEASPPRLGSDLAFSRERDRIVLQLYVPAGGDDEAVLQRRIEAGYEAHLRRYSPERAEVIRHHLGVSVLPYGVRVS
ncbi:MAG: cytochrome c oxidase assembly protein [Dehalococcoidia bacterium]|nr:cytochrome c oxidase assembly protein [Dehalococcoidia bacterium]